MRIVANNKKARHDFFIEETYEAGISLTGTEIKSVRQGKVSIKESYAKIENEEIILYGMNISPYEQGNRFNAEPVRPRKLLMHKREIRKLIGVCNGNPWRIFCVLSFLHIFLILPHRPYINSGFCSRSNTNNSNAMGCIY